MFLVLKNKEITLAMNLRCISIQFLCGWNNSDSQLLYHIVYVSSSCASQSFHHSLSPWVLPPARKRQKRERERELGRYSDPTLSHFHQRLTIYLFTLRKIVIMAEGLTKKKKPQQSINFKGQTMKDVGQNIQPRSSCKCAPVCCIQIYANVMCRLLDYIYNGA